MGDVREEVRAATDEEPTTETAEYQKGYTICEMNESPQAGEATAAGRPSVISAGSSAEVLVLKTGDASHDNIHDEQLTAVSSTEEPVTIEEVAETKKPATLAGTVKLDEDLNAGTRHT